MRAATTALCGFALLFAAGCGGDGDPAEADKGGWRIAAGTYGNVVPDAANGGMRGMQVVLDQGDASASAEFMRCEGTCEAGKRALRRGLNGVSFAIDHDGRTIDVLVGPAGPDAVEISADWGKGIESHRLPKIARAVGLPPTADDAAAPVAPASPMPLVTSSPPPLPSPTP